MVARLLMQTRCYQLLYYTFHHNLQASLVLYELAWKLTRDNNELLWLAITGLTEQLLHEKTDREMYVTEMHRMQPHVLRLNRSEEETVSAVNTMKINFVEEYP
jgi:cell division control protein 45